MCSEYDVSDVSALWLPLGGLVQASPKVDDTAMLRLYVFMVLDLLIGHMPKKRIFTQLFESAFGIY